MKVSRSNKILIVLMAIIFGLLTFKIHNAFDSFPSARAFVSSWLSHDWYLSQFVPYRFLFNLPVGLLYEVSNFWISFFTVKILLFTLLAFALSRIYEKLNISLLTIVASFTYFLSNQSLIAMEWITGDSDAKPVAYILFFFALNDFLSNKLRARTFFLMGLAASFHVLVGGYLSIIFFAGVLFFRNIPSIKWILSFILGASVAIYAVIYELGQTSVPLADQIYIFTRLSHHLVPDWDIHRWLWKYLIFNIFLIWGYLNKDEVWKKIISITLFSNVFWIMGLIVYQLGYHSLLKYYFFRVPDSLIPFTAYILIASLLIEKLPAKIKENRSLIPLVILIFTARFGEQLFNFSKKQNSFAEKEMYSWISKNAPDDAIILADPNYSNFYAFTNRSIYVSYKHLPQIKEYLVVLPERLKFALGMNISSSESLERPFITESFTTNLTNLSESDLKAQGITHILSPIKLDFTLLKSTEKLYFYQIP